MPTFKRLFRVGLAHDGVRQASLAEGIDSNQAPVDARAEHATLAEAVKAKTDTAAALEKACGERKPALLRLEVELESAGAQGLEERRAALARELARRRAEELRRRVAAPDTRRGGAAELVHLG